MQSTKQAGNFPRTLDQLSIVEKSESTSDLLPIVEKDFRKVSLIFTLKGACKLTLAPVLTLVPHKANSSLSINSEEFTWDPQQTRMDSNIWWSPHRFERTEDMSSPEAYLHSIPDGQLTLLERNPDDPIRKSMKLHQPDQCPSELS